MKENKDTDKCSDLFKSTNQIWDSMKPIQTFIISTKIGSSSTWHATAISPSALVKIHSIDGSLCKDYLSVNNSEGNGNKLKHAQF